MATVNRYYTNTPYEYVSQYVPIPFDRLYAVGKEYGERRDAAEKKLTDYVQKVGEFQSLIGKDVDSYYKIALNDGMKQLIDEAAYNPDALKSPEWRSRLAAQINGVDYASLGKLKQSAESAKAYQELYNKLASQGLTGPEGWEPDYFSTYSTIDLNKVFNEAPLAYQSIPAVVRPYVEDMKDSYLGTKGGYDYTGVTELQTEAQVDAYKADILANPQVQRHILILTLQGVPLEEATNQILNAAKTASHEFARIGRTENKFAVAQVEYENQVKLAALKAKLAAENGSESKEKIQLGITDVLHDGYLKFRKNAYNLAKSINGKFADESNAAMSGMQTEMDNFISSLFNSNAQAKAIYDRTVAQLTQRYNPTTDAQRKEIDEYATQEAISSGVLTEDELKTYTDILGRFAQVHLNATERAVGMAAARELVTTLLGNSAYIGSKVVPTDPDKREKFLAEQNPFQTPLMTINTSKSLGYYFGDNKIRQGFENALYAMSPRIDGSTSSTMTQVLFTGHKPITEEVGYNYSPGNGLITPQQFVLNNSYIRDLASKAGIGTGKSENESLAMISDMVQERPGFHIGSNDNFDIARRAANGDFGNVAISEVKGYVESGDSKGYIVKVNIPLKEMRRAYHVGSSPNSSLANSLQDLGYEFTRIAPHGSKDDRWSEGYVTVTEIMPVRNSGLDNFITNQIYQKDVGTSTTRTTQIGLDSENLTNKEYRLGSSIHDDDDE